MSYLGVLNRVRFSKFILLSFLLLFAAFSKAFGYTVNFTATKVPSKAKGPKKSLRRKRDLDLIEQEIIKTVQATGNQLIYSSKNFNDNKDGIAIIISDWHKLNSQDRLGGSIHEINSKTLINLAQNLQPDYILMEGSTSTPESLVKAHRNKDLDQLINDFSVASGVGEIYLSDRGYKFYPAEDNVQIMKQLALFMVQDSAKESKQNLDYSVRGIGGLLFDYENKQLDAKKVQEWNHLLKNIIEAYKLNNKKFFSLRTVEMKVDGHQVEFEIPYMDLHNTNELEKKEFQVIKHVNYKNLISVLAKRNQTIVSKFKKGATVPMIVGHNHVAELVQELEKKNIATFVLAAHHQDQLKSNLQKHILNPGKKLTYTSI